ncbi:phosphatidylcholine and lysophosphatidylcholine phospholipase [Pichia californica]|nr:phosphatidylcholine and lysophosphatidylcholine phospholipase [[Candida] californica]
MEDPNSLSSIISSSSIITNAIPTLSSITTLPKSTIQSSIDQISIDKIHSFNILKPISIIFWFIGKFISNFFYYTLYFLRTLLYSILSTTFQITFSAHSIIFLLLLISTPLYAYIRYTYLTVYSRLPKDSKRQNPILDSFVNSINENDTGHIKSYLDEFLQAIKIFGYLDAPVFHELTKSLQTQKIDSGEIIFLDQCQGFSICVEGEIQVYSKIDKNNSLSNYSSSDLSNDQIFAKSDDSHNVVIVDGIKYQLLNIIKSGAPLSSFIQVLNLLTDSQLTLSSITPTPNLNPQRQLPNLPLDNFSLDSTTKLVNSPIQNANNNNNNNNNNININNNNMNMNNQNLNSNTSVINSAPGLIAIPKNSCTISMIPKESFTRIATKYPKDTSHIIQMILTKLYRVTFQTAHTFLDLTPNIYQTEINLNNYKNSSEKRLPKYLTQLSISIIDNNESFSDDNSNSRSQQTSNINIRQRRKVKNKINSVSPYTESNGFNTSSESSSSLALPLNNLKNKNSKKFKNNNINSSITRNKTPNYLDLLTSDGDESVLSSDTTKLVKASLNNNPSKKSKSRHFVFKNRSNSNPGDLLSNVPLPRNSEVNLKTKLTNIDMDELKNRTFSADDDETEESTLRTALAEKISSLIGLDKNNFPINRANNITNTRSNSILNSPLISATSISTGIRLVTPVNNYNSNNNINNNNNELLSQSKFNKLRTYSTTSVDNSNLINGIDDSSSVNSDVYKSFVNYENVKREFANDIKLFKVSKGTKIIKSKEQTPGIYYVIDGSLDVTYWKRESDFIGTYINEPENDSNDEKEKTFEEYLYTIKEGQIAGYLGSLIGSKSFVDVTANKDTYVAFLSREFFEFLTERYPWLELGIAQLLLKVLDKKLYLTDYALEWVHSSAGDVLYKQSDPANGIYVVLNGRLRAVSKNKDNTDYVILGEYGQGESMGEIEVLTKSKRLNTVVSIRDSELARIPRTLFEIIALSNPSIMVNISRIVANRVKMDGVLFASHVNNNSATAATRIRDEPMVQTFNNFRTITLLPTTHGTIPLVEFGERLANALEKVGKSVKVLNQSAALSNLGKYAFDKLAKLKQGGYFSELEEKYDIVIYLCDAVVNSSWTTTCIQQGDCILLLADANLSPDVGDYERLLVKTKTAARTELILLHPEKYVEPGSTHKWLKNRIWVHSHHHIQMLCSTPHHVDTNSKTFFGQIDNLTLFSKKFMYKMENIVSNNEFLQFLKQTKEDFKSKKYYQPLQEHKDDFMRLARILTGQAIGLVLGGGGARGLSHVGIIKSLEDNGIPVDIIGGTSIGAFVGGLYAKDYDFVPVYGRAKIFAGRMSSVWRSLLDLTIPLTSYLTGHEFNRGIWKAFGDVRIEDFWIKYYANSTNLTDSVMEIHTSGYAWRYIRASMTLASLLPPITDDGNMLLDGGYIDNLTVTEMQRRGSKHIIAVDVGSVDDRSPMEYGNSLSGWWVLLNRMNPFSSHANVPTMADIQMRLAYVASVNALERAKNSKGCSYLRPPIEAYATLAFGKFNEIYHVGVDYGNAQIKDILKKWNVGVKKKQFLPGSRSRRRYSL